MENFLFMDNTFNARLNLNTSIRIGRRWSLCFVDIWLFKWCSEVIYCNWSCFVQMLEKLKVFFSLSSVTPRQRILLSIDRYKLVGGEFCHFGSLFRCSDSVISEELEKPVGEILWMVWKRTSGHLSSWRRISMFGGRKNLQNQRRLLIVRVWQYHLAKIFLCHLKRNLKQDFLY